MKKCCIVLILLFMGYLCMGQDLHLVKMGSGRIFDVRLRCIVSRGILNRVMMVEDDGEGLDDEELIRDYINLISYDIRVRYWIRGRYLLTGKAYLSGLDRDGYRISLGLGIRFHR